MPVIRGQFSDFYLSTMLPAVNPLRDRLYNEYPEVFPMVFRVESSSRSIEQFSDISGVGLATQIDEGQAVRTDSPQQGFNGTFTHTKHGLSIPITRETVADDKMGLVKKMVRSLVRSIKETREYRAASHLNNAFDGSGYPGADGKALCASDHPLYKSGGTQANLLSAAADMDVASIQLMLTMFQTMKDPAGMFWNVPAKNLIYAPANDFNAIEILESSMRSDTANNTTNALNAWRDGKLNRVNWRHLSDDDAWFISADPEDTGLVWYDREKPYKDRWYDELGEVMYEIMRYRAISGFDTFNGIVGTAGA